MSLSCFSTLSTFRKSGAKYKPNNQFVSTFRKSTFRKSGAKYKPNNQFVSTF